MKKSTPAKPDKKTQPKLTAKQKQGVDILQSVEGDLGRYSPEMQTYLLQEMAHAYKDLDRAQQVTLLKEAFQAAANMEEGNYRIEQQRSIVNSLNEADPSALLGMQTSPDPKVREVVLQLLVKQDLDQGKLMAAAQRLAQWDPSLAFPYDYGKQVMMRLTAQQAGERQSVFSSAMAAYRGGESKVRTDVEMTDFILGTYGLVPASMAADAVDMLLNAVAQWEEDQRERFSITTGGNAGSAQFSSLYDYELFELLPVLEKVDSAKADALRREHATVAALNDKYPNGKTSLSTDGKEAGMMFASSPSDSPAPPPATDPSFLQERQQAETVGASSVKDVDGAIASAQSLSNTMRFKYDDSTPRCEALERIAMAAVGRKDYAGAFRATKALAEAAQDVAPLAKAHYFIEAAAIDAEAHDEATAKQYLGKAMKAADELYQLDAFSNEPNEAPKCLWPSTAAWKGTLVVAQRIDPGYAAQESASLPDPEIEAVADVARAGVMLDQEPKMTMIEVRRGTDSVNMEFDTPWWTVPKGGTPQAGQ